MKIKVSIARRVRSFINGLSPQPKKALREGLRFLEEETGDSKALVGNFSGYYRLRVQKYRVIYRYARADEESGIKCVFAEGRAVVYELFADELRRNMKEL